MQTKPSIADCGINPTLVRAVIRQIGDRDSLKDVARHGADGGFSGFIDYADTVAFFKRHRQAIVELVKQRAEDFGENPLDMVAGFQCLGGDEVSAIMSGHSTWIPDGQRESERRKILSEYLPSVSRCLYGGRLTDDDTQTANALAWFALEEVARALNPDL